MIDVNDLIEALTDALNKKSKHDTALEQYAESGGYEWGHHGYWERRGMDEAFQHFGDKLERYIDQRIDQKLKEKSDPNYF